MQIHKLPYTQIPQLSSTDIAYQLEDPRLRPFYQYRPALDAFGEIIQKKHFEADKRNVLAKLWRAQYTGMDLPPLVEKQLEKIAHPHSYTVTTAHQPYLFTEPLYFIYKIAGTIHLSRLLQQHYPQYHFIPVFWMGGEDHDFEEVNHLHLFNKTLTWEDFQGGSVSNYTIESLQPVLEELYNILGESPEADELKMMLRSAFQPQYSYGEGMFRFIHALFGQYGLLVLMPGAAEFKKQMQPIFENDLFQHDSKKIVDKTVEQLIAAGFKNQAYVREVNLFYLETNKRDRIEALDEKYHIVSGERFSAGFSKKEILHLLETQPERFSPNVILRPLYQETILPNLAYIGGGGEIAYWLERKAQFEHFGVPFPMLIRRNSVQLIDTISKEKMNKLGISISGIFEAEEELIKAYVINNTEVSLSFEEELAELEATFVKITEKTVQGDPTLEAMVAAQKAQLFNALDKLETRLMRAEKKKQETAINQISKLKEKLFPGGSLQERYESFIPSYLRHGRAFIDFLVEQLNPLEKDFWLLTED